MYKCHKNSSVLIYKDFSLYSFNPLRNIRHFSFISFFSSSSLSLKILIHSKRLVFSFSNLISIKSSGVKDVYGSIGDFKTASNGISCIGLSIILKNDIIVLISIVSKYPIPVSAYVGIPIFISSSANTGAHEDVALSKMTISLKSTTL